MFLMAMIFLTWCLDVGAKKQAFLSLVGEGLVWVVHNGGQSVLAQELLAVLKLFSVLGYKTVVVNGGGSQVNSLGEQSSVEGASA